MLLHCFRDNEAQTQVDCWSRIMQRLFQIIGNDMLKATYCEEILLIILVRLNQDEQLIMVVLE